MRERAEFVAEMHRDGAVLARRDFARGRCRLYIRGYAASHMGEVCHWLWKHARIRVSLCGCANVLGPPGVCDGYNDEMERLINAVFGRGYVQRMFNMAEDEVAGTPERAAASEARQARRLERLMKTGPTR